MNRPVIIDAGPALNFLATHNERILLAVTGGHVAAPETVAEEVRTKARTDPRFAAASRKWARLEASRRLQVLSDAAAPLRPAADLILRAPLAQRMNSARDLGETMVVLHAATMAAGGQNVIVLIDEWRGAQMATAAARTIPTLARPGTRHGTLTVSNSTQVLARAAGSEHLPNKAAMRQVYEALRTCDDGLVDISQTPLLSNTVWKKPQPTRRP